MKADTSFFRKQKSEIKPFLIFFFFEQELGYVFALSRLASFITISLARLNLKSDQSDVKGFLIVEQGKRKSH